MGWARREKPARANIKHAVASIHSHAAHLLRRDSQILEDSELDEEDEEDDSDEDY